MVTIKSLKEKWAFTNIDVMALLDKIVEVMHHYKHPYVTRYGVACMLDKYIDSKKTLIEMIMKHPDYNGNLQIVTKVPMVREVDRYAVQSWLNDFARNVATESKLVKRTNKDGKTIEQIILEGLTDMPLKVNLNGLMEINERKEIDISSFNRYGESIESRNKYSIYKNLLNGDYSSMFTSARPTLEAEHIDWLKEHFGDGFKMSSSTQKTSRVFNKLAEFMGIDTQKDKSYTTRYAQYADMINPKSNEMYYIISVNPLDYLLMSIGNNWSSCHTIDHTNINQIRCTNGTSTYQGMYRGGTLSYMLDEVSMVTYTLKPTDNVEHPEMERKIYRNMMHYQDGTLIQGRVYPQSKDGATDLYAQLRKHFEDVFIKCIGDGTHNNLWTAPKKTCNVRGDIYTSMGAHYRDYEQYGEAYSGCCYTRLKDFEEKTGTSYTFITIGADGIDLRTGDRHSSSGSLTYDRYADYDELVEE